MINWLWSWWCPLWCSWSIIFFFLNLPLLFSLISKLLVVLTRFLPVATTRVVNSIMELFLGGGCRCKGLGQRTSLSNPAFGWGDEQQFQFQFKHSVYDLMMFGNVSFRLKPFSSFFNPCCLRSWHRHRQGIPCVLAFGPECKSTLLPPPAAISATLWPLDFPHWSSNS